MICGRADEQWGEPGSQMPSRSNVRGAENGIADALDQPGIGNDVSAAGSNLGHNRTKIRRVVRRTGYLAAETIMHGIEMVADSPRVRHRPDQAEMLRQLRKARVQLAEVHSGNR